MGLMREWYIKVEEKLTDLGGKVSLYDQSLFLWHEDNQLVGIVVAHVDDFTYCGTARWHEGVVEEVTREFKISKRGKGAFKYIGLNIEQTDTAVFVDQTQYVKSLKEIEVSPERKKKMIDVLNEQEIKELRSLCGQLLWVTSQTRPDVSFQGCMLSNY